MNNALKALLILLAAITILTIFVGIGYLIVVYIHLWAFIGIAAFVGAYITIYVILMDNDKDCSS